MGLSRPLAFEVFRTPYHFRKTVSGIALCVIRDVDIAASERGDDLLLASSNGPGSAAGMPRTRESGGCPAGLRQFANWVMWGKLPRRIRVAESAPHGQRHCPERPPRFCWFLDSPETMPRLSHAVFGITRLVHTCSAESCKSPDERIADNGCQC